MDEQSPQRQTYAALGESLRQNNIGWTRRLFAESAVITLPGTNTLTVDEFLIHMQRLRGIFADFGENVTIIEMLEVGNTLAVCYDTLTTSTHTQTMLEYTSVDWVTFDDSGKIARLRVIYDRTENRQQLNL